MATEVTFIRSGGLSLREKLARGGGGWGVGGWWRWITQSFPMRPPTPLHPALSPTITVSCVPGQVPRSLWSGSSKSGQKQSPLQAQGGRKMRKRGWAGSHSCRFTPAGLHQRASEELFCRACHQKRLGCQDRCHTSDSGIYSSWYLEALT